MKLNLCCGDNKIDGFISVDITKRSCPDLCFDVSKQWPLKDESVDWIAMFHAIEHFRESEQDVVLFEASRTMKFGASMILSYPEFIKCAQNYISNHLGKRDFWKATIYGRGLDIWDTHKTLMDTTFFKEKLASFGFDVVREMTELPDTFNTVLHVTKSRKAFTYEQTVRDQFFTVAA